MSLFGDEINALDPQPDDASAVQTQTDTLLEPKSSTLCLGHDPQEKLFLELYKNNNIPHAMVFQGLKGIGKTTMAFRLARFLLKNGKGMDASDGLFGGDALPQDITSLDVSPDDPVFRRIASGGHADLLYIHRGFDKSKGKKDSSLKVEALRQIEPFLRKTASEGGWRIVIIEDADTMNRNAQNAILKILEEPPSHVLIMLITTRPGMLIPTIHSRTRKVMFEPLSTDTMHVLIEKYGESLSHDDLTILNDLSGGSIGEAVNYIENGGLDILKDVLDYMNHAHNGEIQKLHEVSVRLGMTSQDREYRMFVHILQWVFRKMLFLKARNDTTLPAYMDRPVTQSIMGSHSMESVLKICDSLKTHFERIDFSNLDRRDAVRSAFLMINE